jgi:two-component system sensor histidine kinase RegB
MLALAWQLYFSGGTSNPFTFLFLMQIVIAAILLPPNWSAIVAVMGLIVARLAFVHRPLDLPTGTFDGTIELFQLGNLVCFVLVAALLVFFVIRMDRNRRQSETALAALRQQPPRSSTSSASACSPRARRTSWARRWRRCR